MGLRINQNIAAMNAYRTLSANDSAMAKSLEKLSSGFRINRAADDAAGLSISESLRAQAGGLKVAVRNAQDGISLVQTAEGGLNEVHSLLQRVRDLAVQSANTGGNTQEARDAAAAEVQTALDEIDRISSTTEFGGKKLLDGSNTGGFTFHVGSGAGSENQVTVNIAATSANGLSLKGTAAQVSSGDLPGTVTGGGDFDITYNTGVTGATDVSTTVTVGTAGNDYDTTTAQGREDLLTDVNTALSAATNGAVQAELIGGTTTGTYQLRLSTAGTGANASLDVTAGSMATEVGWAAGAVNGSGSSSVADLVSAGSTSAITAIDAAISQVSSQRANLGAYQNRLEHTIANLSVTQENITASESRIRDTDMAQEMVAMTRSQILTQAGTAMLAQANSSSQNVLQLLRG